MALLHLDVQHPAGPKPHRPLRVWRAADVAIVVAVACYGAAMLIVAAGLFARLAR